MEENENEQVFSFDTVTTWELIQIRRLLSCNRSANRRALEFIDDEMGKRLERAIGAIVQASGTPGQA